MAKKKDKDLVEIIKANPGCIAIVDNDCWWLYRKEFKAGEDYTEKEIAGLELACDSDVAPRGDGGYGSGSCYGGDLLQALAAIVGVKIESV